MVSAGLNEDMECWSFCTGTIAHPHSNKGNPGSNVTLSYQFRPTMGARLTWSTLNFGETLGYREPFMHMFVSGRMQSLSLVAYYTPNGTLRLAPVRR